MKLIECTISVCMATYNGDQYLKAQIDGILNQLSIGGELVISDDHSTDNTCVVIKQYDDSRIGLILNELAEGVTHNFEDALLYSNGDIIFLADQDDIWLPTKMKELGQFLLHGDCDVVTGNCALTDSELSMLQSEYYTTQSPLDKSACGNFIKNLRLGSCIAFKYKVLLATFPLPKKMATHDLWIALYSQLHFKCGYYPKVLQFYRRRGSTVSFAGSKSTNKLSYKISYRLYLVYWLLVRSDIKVWR